MKILANLGTLPDGRCALAIKDAYFPNFVVVSNYDEETQTWSSGKYFDGSLTAFAQYITEETRRLEEEKALESPMTTAQMDAWKDKQARVKRIGLEEMGRVVLREILDTEQNEVDLSNALENFCRAASQEEKRFLSSFLLEVSEGKLNYPPEFLTASRAFSIGKEMRCVFEDIFIRRWGIKMFISDYAGTVGETFHDLIMAVQTPNSIQPLQDLIEALCGSDLKSLIQKAEEIDCDLGRVRSESPDPEEREI